jgi:hypothetical protein
MTEETKNEKEEKSLNDLLGMDFKEDGSWTAKDLGNTPIYRKLNRKERRTQRAMQRKINKKVK